MLFTCSLHAIYVLGTCFYHLLTRVRASSRKMGKVSLICCLGTAAQSFRNVLASTLQRTARLFPGCRRLAQLTSERWTSSRIASFSPVHRFGPLFLLVLESFCSHFSMFSAGRQLWMATQKLHGSATATFHGHPRDLNDVSGWVAGCGAM